MSAWWQHTLINVSGTVYYFSWKQMFPNIKSTCKEQNSIIISFHCAKQFITLQQNHITSVSRCVSALLCPPQYNMFYKSMSLRQYWTYYKMRIENLNEICQIITLKKFKRNMHWRMYGCRAAGQCSLVGQQCTFQYHRQCTVPWKNIKCWIIWHLHSKS
jgi:hypothetical protein